MRRTECRRTLPYRAGGGTAQHRLQRRGAEQCDDQRQNQPHHAAAGSFAAAHCGKHHPPQTPDERQKKYAGKTEKTENCFEHAKT